MRNLSEDQLQGRRGETAYHFSASNTAADYRIIEGLRNRDGNAMASLYDCYGRLVYSLVYRIVGNQGEAEDIVQESFFRVWTRAHLIDSSRGSLRTWLLEIARNLAIDYLRTVPARHRNLHEPFWDRGLAPARSGNTFLDHTDQLQAAYAQLTSEQRTVIELAYFEGMSQNEISARLGKPLGTVKTWVRTALRILRKNFDILPPEEEHDENPAQKDLRSIIAIRRPSEVIQS